MKREGVHTKYQIIFHNMIKDYQALHWVETFWNGKYKGRQFLRGQPYLECFLEMARSGLIKIHFKQMNQEHNTQHFYFRLPYPSIWNNESLGAFINENQSVYFGTAGLPKLEQGSGVNQQGEVKIQNEVKLETKQEVVAVINQQTTRPKRIKEEKNDLLSIDRPKRCQIKPQRSALTNIGNQILTYLYIQKKSSDIILRMFPEITEDELASYYSFAKKLKECMYGYFNKRKLQRLWQNRGKNPQDILNYKIIRKLSNYYLQSLLPSSIITSKKMPIQAKPLHMKIRRRVLSFLSRNEDISDL